MYCAVVSRLSCRNPGGIVNDGAAGLNCPGLRVDQRGPGRPVPVLPAAAGRGGGGSGQEGLVVGCSIHPSGLQVGTGGRTCSRPSSPQTLHLALIGRRRSPRPASIIPARSSCAQRSQRGHWASRSSCLSPSGGENYFATSGEYRSVIDTKIDHAATIAAGRARVVSLEVLREAGRFSAGCTLGRAA